MQKTYLIDLKVAIATIATLGNFLFNVIGPDISPAKVIEARTRANYRLEASQSLNSVHQHTSRFPEVDITKIPAPEPGSSIARIRPETRLFPKENADGTGQFRFTCTFSHMSFDDPIVHPGKKGAAHLHVFFGNTAVDHNSDEKSVQTSGDSTCAGGTANRTAYWVPAVIDTKDGTPLRPNKILVYYKSDATGGLHIRPYPAGLRMVAGDMMSSSAQRRTDFGCIGPDGKEERFFHIPPDCGVGSILEMTINFPMCWDGLNLDSADHKSHMAFVMWNNDVRRNLCPKTHPVALPALTQKIQYIVPENGATQRWRLSSDNYSMAAPGGYSIHADWFNGWDQDVQSVWINGCLRANRDCHGMLLGNGTTLF